MRKDVELTKKSKGYIVARFKKGFEGEFWYAPPMSHAVFWSPLGVAVLSDRRKGLTEEEFYGSFIDNFIEGLKNNEKFSWIFEERSVKRGVDLGVDP